MLDYVFPPFDPGGHVPKETNQILLPFTPRSGRSDLQNPLNVLYVWDGGLSFHGGLIGVILAIIYSSKTSKVPIIFQDVPS